MVFSHFIRKIFFVISLCTFHFALFTSSAYAISDPLSVSNNKFGIHIISPSIDEASPAAELVNSSGGDWGYITVLMEAKNRNKDSWQKFFNDLRRRHLIPILRLATRPVFSHWEVPPEAEAKTWANFLDSLIWPTKNRYIVIYNEPNQGKEWGGTVGPQSYTQILKDTIDALKQKSQDFFILNAGFDQSAPQKLPDFMDEEKFLEEMNLAVPGIFNKLDGWVSHSYPNPGFTGSPSDSGKASVRGWFWELGILKKYGLTKELPVFITETGWKHSEGIYFDKTLPSSDDVADHFKDAFANAWSSQKIVAVTPFLLNYQEIPFDHFSFKKLTSHPDFYPAYQTIVDLPKTAGHPIQENKASLQKGEIYSSLVAGQEYSIPLTFKNIGQSIWNETGQVGLVASQGVALEPVEIPMGQKVEPGQEYTFNIKLKAPLSGIYNTNLNLFSGGKQFSSKPVEFKSEVKSPVILVIKSTLKWKKDFSGSAILKIAGAVGESLHDILLKLDGQSDQIEARYLLPGYTFDFNLEKPFYKPKAITQRVESGVNILDFGELEPEILLSLFNPYQLWKILPLSN